MLSIYIGVYKALYDYAAQAEEELNIKQNDLLYLLEKYLLYGMLTDSRIL